MKDILYIPPGRGKQKSLCSITGLLSYHLALIPKNVQVQKNKMPWKLQPDRTLVSVPWSCLN